MVFGNWRPVEVGVVGRTHDLEQFETSFAGSRMILLAYAPNRELLDVLRCIQGDALEIYEPNVVE
jgi:hypothetical protein